jgi:hypothetical protein
MSFLSMFGLLVFLCSVLVFYMVTKALQANNQDLTFMKIYCTSLIIIIITEIVLAWNIGPGFYGMKFWN